VSRGRVLLQRAKVPKYKRTHHIIDLAFGQMHATITSDGDKSATVGNNWHGHPGQGHVPRLGRWFFWGNEMERHLADIINDLVFSADVEGNILYANALAREFTGYEPEETVGHHFAEYVHPDDVPDLVACMQKVLNGGPTKTIAGNYQDAEYRMVRPDGEVIWVATRSGPVTDMQGKVVGFSAVTRDITERRRAQKALEGSEERYRNLFEHIPVGLYRTTLEGQILDANPAVVQMLGYPDRETLLAVNAADTYVDPEDRRRWQALMQQEGVVRNHEARWYRRDGSVIWLRNTARAIRDDTGRLLYYEGVLEDVTERRQMERRVRQSERLAAMGHVAAVLSHEINNPLQAIRANLELALDFDLGSSEHERHLQIVRQEIERLAEIAQRMLDLARPADETRYPVSIVHLMQETLKLLDKQLELAHVRATTDFPTDLPSVFVAPGRIMQVLLNLSVNAIEAMPDGGRLHIAARADETGVELALTNDAPPLSPEHIERIFDPFFTTKPGGTGLGLSISHSIVDRHGGTISVQNLKGNRGVTFTVALPVAPLVKEGKAA
jgi:two-component system sporulation sensor kinase A